MTSWSSTAIRARSSTCRRTPSRRPSRPCPTRARSDGRTPTLVPAWQFGGEACVIDCRDLRDSAPAGHSPLIKKERVIAWEKEHRPLGPGDVVLFHSGYSDAYYKALPEGRRYAALPLEGNLPPGPVPIPTAWSTWPGAKS